jgi:glycosyltransferase involved in cell wall biosynthesis
MKCGHVLPWISRNAGGLFPCVSGLAKAQAAIDGMQVEVFGSQDEYADEDRSEWHPVKVHTAPVLGPSRLCCMLGLPRMVERYGPDIIHSAAVWTWPAAMINRLHARKRIPFVLSPHGSLNTWALGRSAWKKSIALRLFQQQHFDRAACIHALSESELTSVRQYGLKNPVCVIPNGIQMPQGRQASQMSHPDLDERRILLYLGRIHPIKGLENLVRAWATIRKAESRNCKVEDWVLVIAGPEEGEYERELQTLTQKAGAQDSVVFVGPKFGEEKEALYRSCEAFILPSFSEGMPMVVLEAWAYGKPVLMTPECNLPEGFAAGAAVRIEPETESIKAGLRTLFQASSSELRTMGEKGRALVAERFTWPHIAREMKAVYDWVLGGGTAPACVHLL